MVRDIYFFRHGQTDYNLQNKWQGGRIDAVLNETGHKQAEELAEKVKDKNISVLYCSPLVRAVQTANKIALAYGGNLLIVIMQDLREGYFGKAEGKSFDELYAEFGVQFVEDFCWPTFDNWDNHYPQGESKHEIFNRVKRCLLQILLNDDEGAVGVVCHGGVMSALKAGLGLKNTPNENCSILHLQYDSETKEIKQIFD